MSPREAAALFAAAGIATAPVCAVGGESDAVDRWRHWSRPVMLKGDVHGVVHKTRAGAVLGPLDTAGGVASAYRTLCSRFENLRGVIVQPQQTGTGPELLAGIAADPVYGPLITIGLGGIHTDLLDDPAHYLAPATEGEVDDLLARLRASRGLFTGTAGTGLRDQLREVVAGLSWLATHHPELAEAEINPLIPTERGLIGVDARVRLAPRTVSDPWLRTLPA